MACVDGERFRQVQEIPARWRWLGLLGGAGGIAVFAWAAAVDPPRDAWETLAVGLVMLVLVFVVAMVAFAKLIIVVSGSVIDVRWWILLHRSIPRRDIARVAAVVYRPIREFGGWGIRFGRKGARCYSISGDRAVELTLTDGRRVLLGSLDPEPLAAAIRT